MDSLRRVIFFFPSSSPEIRFEIISGVISERIKALMSSVSYSEFKEWLTVFCALARGVEM